MSFDLKFDKSDNKYTATLFFKHLSDHGHRMPVFIETEPSSVDSIKKRLIQALSVLNMDCELMDGHCHISQDKHIKSLGLETTHIILNITNGLDIRALLAIAGKIKAGNCLFVLMPRQHVLREILDATAPRWFNYCYEDLPAPVQAPKFYQYLHGVIEHTDPLIVLNEQTDFLCFFNTFEYIPNHQSKSSSFSIVSGLTDEQSNVINSLKHSPHYLSLLCAKRGRGKSYTVAHWISHLYESNIRFTICAPRKSLFKFDKKVLDYFCAPDELTQKCIEWDHTFIHSGKAVRYAQYLSEWLIVDEAASIPLAIIQKWIKYFKHILLVTTLEGYEGSGHAIRLKLLEQQKDVKVYQLHAPIRYAENDPLELFVDKLSLNYHVGTDENTYANSCNELIAGDDDPKQRLSMSIETSLTIASAKQLYSFFRQFHYQTSINDLRRLFDGQQQFFVSLFVNTHAQEHLIGAAWALYEGGASIKLAKQIWLGRRRPKANLFAQSLSIHANSWFFPCMLGVRITRIGIDKVFRRYHFATKIVEKIIALANEAKKDYVSVSFGFTFEIYTFWQKMGFKTVHISHKADASSGLNSIMMIKPLSVRASHHSQQCMHELYNAFVEKIKSNKSDKDFDPREQIFELINPIEISQTHLNTMMPAAMTRQQALFMICGFAYFDRSLAPTRVALDYFLANKQCSDSDIQIEIHKVLSQTLTKNELLKFKHLLANWIDYRFPEFKSAFDAWVDSDEAKFG